VTAVAIFPIAFHSVTASGLLGGGAASVISHPLVVDNESVLTPQTAVNGSLCVSLNSDSSRRAAVREFYPPVTWQ
jgi:hypothetical protein